VLYGKWELLKTDIGVLGTERETRFERAMGEIRWDGMSERVRKERNQEPKRVQRKIREVEREREEERTINKRQG